MARTLLENANYLNETIKPAIKSAIIAQGVSVSDSDSFLSYATKIGQIGGGGGGAYELWDYIQSDGSQYINTGRQIAVGDTIKVMYAPLAQQDYTTWHSIWGAYDGNNTTTRLVITSSNQKDRYDGGAFVDRTSWAANTIYIDSLTVSNALNADVYVFNATSDVSWGSKVVIYSFAINGDYFLPCKRKSDGVFGLWDVANQTFLGDSAGGNAFVGGSKIMDI